MRYSREAWHWSELPSQATVHFRPYRRVELPRSLLLLSSDSPGWAAIPNDEIDALSQLDGTVVGQLPAQQAERLEPTLRQLFQAGLIEIDGRSGLSGKREDGCCGGSRCAAKAEPTPVYAGARVATDGAPAPPHALLIKLTGACNWACTYCYDYDRGRFRKTLALEDVAKSIESIVGHHGRIALMFHGGEPLMRYSELQRIVDFTNDRCHAVGGRAQFSLQTNGAYVTKDVIEFLNRHSFAVGMSIDGPPHLNDLTRVDHRGRGTTHVLEDLFERERDFMINRVGYITTVTSKNVRHLGEVARYLKGVGVRSWKTAIFDVEGRGEAFPELRPEVAPYIAFVESWLEECESGAWEGFKFNNILELLDVISSPKRPNLCLKFPCGAGREFMVASADGKMLACDATYHPSFVLGSTAEGDLASAQRSANAEALFERENWLLTEAPCATCPWLHYCAGTCMAKALIKHGTVKAVDDFECAVRKAILPLLFEKLIDPGSKLRTYYLSCRRNGRAEGT